MSQGDGLAFVDGVHRPFSSGSRRFCLSIIVLRHSEKSSLLRPSEQGDAFELAFHLTDDRDRLLENGWWEARINPTKLKELVIFASFVHLPPICISNPLTFVVSSDVDSC